MSDHFEQRLTRLEERHVTLRRDVDQLISEIGSRSKTHSISGRVYLLEGDKLGIERASEAVKAAQEAVRQSREQRWSWPARLGAVAIACSAVGGFVLDLIRT